MRLQALLRCWQEPQELLEVSCCVLLRATGQVVGEYQAYVRPTEHPVLTAFCTELTGITQAQCAPRPCPDPSMDAASCRIRGARLLRAGQIAARPLRTLWTACTAGSSSTAMPALELAVAP